LQLIFVKFAKIDNLTVSGRLFRTNLQKSIIHLPWNRKNYRFLQKKVYEIIDLCKKLWFDKRKKSRDGRLYTSASAVVL